MAAKDVAPLIAKEFVAVKIDYERAAGAKDIGRRFIAKEPGLPWFAFLRSDGTCLIQSIKPDGSNIGYPFKPDEVAYFKTMLQSAKKHLTDEDINSLIRSIEAFNKAK